jgi:predicted AAA+ superfamily ATPase
MKTYIPRDYYAEKLTPYINKDLIKVVIGQRRVGKSYILRQTIDQIKKSKVTDKNILYIDKENFEFNNIKNEEDLINYCKKYFPKTNPNSKQKNYLFIDEVQEIKNFHLALRSLNASGNFDIYITGSNANILSADLANTLGGRYQTINVYGLSYVEFLQFHDLNNSNESFNHYLKYGSLPYLIHLEENEEIRYSYLKGILNSIVLKDIVKRYEIRNVDFLERLIRFIADNVGSPFSAKSISDYLKSEGMTISPSVIINYLKYLHDVFFIYQVSRIEVEGKKIFQTNEKYYFNDLGIRNALVGFKANDINKVLENVVYQELRRRFDEVYVGKTQSDTEIDFVVESSGKREYFQVSYLIKDDKTFKREFENFARIDDNYPKTVLSMDEIVNDGYKGIKHMRIPDFLLS